ncbi:glycosyltransferase [Colwellia sp. 20A7]|uniref:glycosyltransferase n=1 Tax=Colwellia sp. 20A7 TaxID=2689569 RepID=UPI00135CD3EF|nr:glycosyltransferase family 2 protein [Colwellia sp. 20A7]
MNLSIVFATYKNEKILQKSLEAYCLIETKYQWELIIIDNACRQETRELIERYKQYLPIVFLEQPIPGKNSALNLALPLIKSDLVLFTDNDILPNDNLVTICVEAAKNYSDVSIFSGQILPDRELPLWLDTTSHRICSALGIYNKGEQDKDIFPEDVWGGNMLVKKEVFTNGVMFNTSVGPNGKDYVMGSETELLKRLQADGFKAMYLASSKVYHQIRDEQLSLDWLSQRALRSGKGSAFNNEDNAIKLCGVPRYLFKKLVIDYLCLLKATICSGKRLKCLTSMEYYFTKGKVQQVKQQSK